MPEQKKIKSGRVRPRQIMMAALIFSMVPTSGILAAEMHKRSSGLSSAGETGATSPRIAVIDPLTPPLFAIEHDKVARNAGTENKLLWFRSHRRNGAGVQCASQLELMRRSLSRGTPGLHGASPLCVMTRLPSPPLTAGSLSATILSSWWPLSIVTAIEFA